jgi:uncharacterized protein (TIGR03435 family)
MTITKPQAAVIALGIVLAVGGGVSYVLQNRSENQSAAAPPIVSTPAARNDEAALRNIISQMSSRALEAAPPAVFVGESLSGMEQHGTLTMNNKFMGTGVTIQELLAVAYGTSRTRIRTTGVNLSPGHFDYLVSLPSGQKEALQELLRSRFGLEAHPETLEEDVHVLTARAGEFENLRPSEASERGMRIMNNDDSLRLQNVPISALAKNLEQMGSLPVVDETNLRGRFDIELHWEPGEQANRPSVDALSKALSEQLGFSLQKERRPLEVLLVENRRR